MSDENFNKLFESNPLLTADDYASDVRNPLSIAYINTVAVNTTDTTVPTSFRGTSLYVTYRLPDASDGYIRIYARDILVLPIERLSISTKDGLYEGRLVKKEGGGVYCRSLNGIFPEPQYIGALVPTDNGEVLIGANATSNLDVCRKCPLSKWSTDGSRRPPLCVKSSAVVVYVFPQKFMTFKGKEKPEEVLFSGLAVMTSSGRVNTQRAMFPESVRNYPAPPGLSTTGIFHGMTKLGSVEVKVDSKLVPSYIPKGPDYKEEDGYAIYSVPTTKHTPMGRPDLVQANTPIYPLRISTQLIPSKYNVTCIPKFSIEEEPISLSDSDLLDFCTTLSAYYDGGKASLMKMHLAPLVDSSLKLLSSPSSSEGSLPNAGSSLFLDE